MKTKFSLFALCILCSCTNQVDDLVSVSGVVSDTLGVEGKQSYLFIQYENQAQIIDSCIIKDNKFEFEGSIPFDEVMGEVIIDQIPASSGSINLSKGNKVEFEFVPNGKFARPNVVGSENQSEIALLLEAVEPTSKQRSQLYRKRRTLSPDDEQQSIIKDSISYYTQQINDKWLEMFKSTKSGFNAIFSSMTLAYSVSPEEKEQMKQDIIKRFPANINLSMVTDKALNGEAVAETSPQSKWAFNRYAQIVGDPIPFPAEEIPELDNTTIKPYKIGDIVSDLDLPGAAKKIDLYSIEAPYVLVEFWASWCKPCREEAPNIKKVVEKYPSQFAVYAISIDKNVNQWSSAIKKDATQSFNHVILRQDNLDMQKINALFSLEIIPANFLLDKDHKIIATDLRGDDLELKIKELTK